MASGHEAKNNRLVKFAVIIIVCLALIGAAAYVVLHTPDDAKPKPGSATTASSSINIGVNINDSPGFSVTHDGQRSGFEIDLANYVANELKRHPNFVPITIDSRGRQLQQGYVDMVVSIYSITDERIAEGIIFAGPYIRTDQGILTTQANDTIQSIGDLAGKTVCATRGSTSTNKLNELKKTVALIIAERDTLTQCIEDMKNTSSSVAAVTSDAVVLQGHARSDPSLRYVPGIVIPGTYEKYGIGLAKRNMQLCHQVASLLKDFVNTQWNSAFSANLQGPGVANASQLKPEPSSIDTEACRTIDQH